jgi:hypothetical protein
MACAGETPPVVTWVAAQPPPFGACDGATVPSMSQPPGTLLVALSPIWGRRMGAHRRNVAGPERETDMRTMRVIAVAALLCCMVAGQAVWGATEEEVTAAKLEKDLAEAKRDKEKADTERAKNKIGDIDTSKLPKGTVDAKNLHIEGKILAYDAVDRIAGIIAKDVAPHVGKSTVVIYSDKELNAVMQSRAFLKNLKTLNAELPKLRVPPLNSDEDNPDCKKKAVGGALLGPLDSVEVALQVAALFKVDKKFEGSDVQVDDFALATAVMSKLKARGGGKIIYPATYLPGIFAGPNDDIYRKSEITQELDKLANNEAQLDGVMKDISHRRESIKARSVDKTKIPPGCVAVFPADLKVLDNYEARTTSMKSRAEKFLSAATTVDEKTGATLLQLLASSETMARDHMGAYVLQLKSIAGGGTMLTKTNIFTTSFRMTGGAIVSYMLINGVDGTVVSLGNVPDYGGYVKPEDLQRLVRTPSPAD